MTVHKTFKWITPIVIAAAMILAWCGWLSPRNAALTAMVVEGLLAVILVTVAAKTVTRLRGLPKDGHSRWWAAQAALSGVLPRRLARLIVVELRLFTGLGRSLFTRTPQTAHTYGRDAKPLLWAILALGFVEGLVIDFIIQLIWPGSAWAIVVGVLHIYAILWIAGILASLKTQPHLVDASQILLRDSVFHEIRVPIESVLHVERALESGPLRSGFVIDSESGELRMTHGDAAIRIYLAPTAEVTSAEGPIQGIKTIIVSADDPRQITDAVRSVIPEEVAGEIGWTTAAIIER
ncbi:hypothetical protein GOEFS_132_00220 [Gordonia effusa NBRC 100432]|uniref:Uncharacterized protein n=1 Tax=Gordonia effusa NBRC 100432 TaxID=1077974 RepID=H0R6U0_9ACTN|nr:hypothetical protein [Gordonia effusa]GAB20791.1 hypothetical protein GOEFS_132_00220 [Gordonia effusa NBRC 100432]